MKRAVLELSLFLLLGLVMPLWALAGPVHLGPGSHTRAVMVDGLARRYLVYVPAAYDPARPTPLVLAYHGGGGGPASMQRLSGLNQKAELSGFIVAYPFGSGPDPAAGRGLSFNAGNCCAWALRNHIDDVGFTRALLDDLASVVSVDADRVYATGMSNGAIMAYRLAAELSERIAAVAPVGGPMGQAEIAPTRPVSVVHFHGLDDAFAPFEGGRSTARNGRPGPTDFFSVAHTIQAWVGANGCGPEPSVEILPDTAPQDQTRVTRKTYSGGREGAEVVLYEIAGGGHTWPGQAPLAAFLGRTTQDISANDLMWEFFERHPRPPARKGKPAAGEKKPPQTNGPRAGTLKQLPDTDASRDAAGQGQLFEAVHAPGFTDVREGLNGFALGDFDKNGYLDILAVTTPPFALDKTWADKTGEVARTRDPRDRLRLLLNFGGFEFREKAVTLSGSAARPDDLSQGWRGGQVPALADFDGDGFLDIFISRQAPMSGGRIRPGMAPVGCSLFLSQGGFDRYQDVSRAKGALNELAYNRQVSLGDVNRDGFIDIAIGADNIVNAFEGLPISALFVFEPRGGGFEGGVFKDIGGTALVPDFGGFYHDSARDRAGPNIALRDMDNDADLDLMQSCHVIMIPNVPPDLPYSPAGYRHGFFGWRNLLAETGRFGFEKVTDNGLALEARMYYDQAAGLLKPMTQTRSPALGYFFFADVNNDGLLDALAVANNDQAIRPSTDPVGARFWYNLGGFRFQEATREAGLEPLNQTYRQWYGFFGAQVGHRLANYDPTRRVVRSQPGLEPKNPLDNGPNYSDAVFADFDNDGWLDLVVLDRLEVGAIETRSFLFMNRSDGTFEPRTTEFSGLNGTGISGEAADLNNDGLVDLIVSADPDNTGKASGPRRYESMVFMNTGLHGGREKHWLRLRFSGLAHAALLGARVEVRAAGSDRLLGMRGVYSNQAYKSGSPLEAHFGLGKVDKADILVVLPGGRRVRVGQVQADRYLDLNLADGTVSEVKFAP